MSSLSSLLNPSTTSDDGHDKVDNASSNTLKNGPKQEQEDPSSTFYRPTSVTELLISQNNIPPRKPASKASSKKASPESHSSNHGSSSKNGNLHTASGGMSNSADSYTKSNASTANSKTNGTGYSENVRGYQTLLINARSRHLKKNDGEPYWRNEVQFEFLMRLLFNHDRVFKNPYLNTIHGFDWPDHFRYYKDENGTLHASRGEMLTFFELYLITLLKSSKISKILKARLMLDINYALNFAVICLLVNIGRLNTTVNFDYEMKSQFRTYHSIPSLQVGNHFNIIENYYQIHEILDDEQKNSKQHEAAAAAAAAAAASNTESNDNRAYLSASVMASLNQSVRNGSGYTMSTVKQLQDTPRIKSILKSVNDLSGKIPKTYKDFIAEVSTENHQLNIVSTVFLICAHEYDIGQSFFPFDYDDSVAPSMASTGSLMNDIWLRPKFKPSDKVRKFLWLIYTLMETNLSIPEIMANPFNVGSPNLIQIDNGVDLAQEIAIIDHKNPRIAPTINKLRNIIPKWSVMSSMDVVDPLVNDFDTAQEVEFAAQMKHLRAQFVENESYNNNAASNNVNYGEETSAVKSEGDSSTKASNIVLQSDATGRSIQMKQPNERNRKSRHDSDEFSPHFYHPDKNRNYSRRKVMESATSSHGLGLKSGSGADSLFNGTRTKLDSDNHDYNDYENENISYSGGVGDIKGNTGGDVGYDHVDERGSNDNDYNNNNSDDVNGNQDETDEENVNSSRYNDSNRLAGEEPTGSFSKGVKRPNDESVELSAIDPMVMSSFEDNYEDGGLIGFFNYGYVGPVVNEYRKGEDGSMILTSCVKKRKTRKQFTVEPPIKTTVNKIEAFLNRDNKSVNSNSKNALAKREKNRMIAEFIYELIKYKQSQAKSVRLREGNWRHFTKHLWDLNMFVEKEQRSLHSNYADWGEFKTTMMKVMNKVNCVMNARIRTDSVMDSYSTKPNTPVKKEKAEGEDIKEDNVSFIDDIFSQL